MLARGSLGNPWLFERLLGARDGEPDPRRGDRRARWVIERCRGAPRRGARGPLAAQVLPLVRGTSGAVEVAHERADDGARRRGGAGDPAGPRSAHRGMTTSTQVADLDLPQFDFMDPDGCAGRFHEVMRELRGHGWLAQSPLGFYVLDRDSVDLLPPPSSAEVPRPADRRAVRRDRPARCTRRSEEHPVHRRRRSPAAAQPRQPGAARRARSSATGRRSAVPRRALVEGRRAGGCEFVADFAKPYPALTIATVMGAPL